GQRSGPVRRPGEAGWKFFGRKLFATRSIDELLAESQGELKATLTWFDLTCLGIGIIIGSGIFVYTGLVAAVNTGPAISSAFIIAGIVSTLSALSFSELASMIPVAGSAYTYAYATMGEIIAWIIGWNLILEYMAGSAAVSVGWSAYMVTFLDKAFGLVANPHLVNSPIKWVESSSSFFTTGNYINIPAIVVAILVGCILVIGTKESAIFTTVMVCIKIVVVLLFIGFAAPHVDTARYTPYLPENTGNYGEFGATGLLKGASVVFFAYIGFDSVSTAAQEAKNPGRDMPIGIISSLVICTILYIAVSLVMVGIIPYDQLNTSSPISTAINYIDIHWLSVVVSFGAMAGLTSVMLVQIMAQARVFYSMARDGLLPPIFYKVHPKFKTPWLSTILITVIVAIMGAFLPTDFLGEMTSVGTLCAFFFVNLGVMVLRITQPTRPRRFTVPFGPYVIPLLGAASCIFLIATSAPTTIYRLFAWIGIGLLVYVFYGRRWSKVNNPEKWANIDIPDAMAAH
ncbi:MAG: amino acid permease, partial [Bacillus cereus]|nr:amino acid permease [Bacillus cereus]